MMIATEKTPERDPALEECTMNQLPSSITLCEVGLRDGLQNEKTLLPTQEKVALLRGLIEAGFSVIEVGSFMHPKAVPQMADTDEVYRAVGAVPGVELRALIPNLRGVQRAAACGCKKVKLNVSASRQHNLKNLNMTPEESVAGFADCVRAAGESGIAISGSISMPFASPWEGRIPVSDVEAIVGWLHFHNTRGLAMANIMAAMEAGMTRFDSSFGGLGGCPFVPGAAGNISTEDVLNFCEESGIATGIDLEQVMELSRSLRRLLGHDLDSYVLRAGRARDLILS